MFITHLGHACVLLEVAGTRILIDPGVFTPGFEQLTGLDAVLVTHVHGDHYDAARLPALMSANPDARLLAEPGTAARLTAAGLDAAPLAAGDAVTLGALTVTAAGGRHAAVHRDVPRVGNVGLLVGAEGEPTLFHPGDSYETVPAGVDVLAVPLGAPWAALRETIDFVRAVAAPVAVPIHEGTLSAGGRGIHLSTLTGLVADRTEVRDLAGAGATSLG